MVNSIVSHGNIKKKKCNNIYGGYTLDEGGYTADDEDNTESTFCDKGSFHPSAKSNNENEDTYTFMVDGLEQILLKVLKL